MHFTLALANLGYGDDVNAFGGEGDFILHVEPKHSISHLFLQILHMDTMLIHLRISFHVEVIRAISH